MCNRYANHKSAAEIADYFDALAESESNVASEVYPGTNGYVIESGKLVSMTWGFPLVTSDMRARTEKTGKSARPKPVNNARMDKIGSPFWKRFASDPAHRCLIPVEKFAEAEGPKGKMTQTWFSMKAAPMFACAGLWRDSPEWGRVYTMMMTDANKLVSEVHNRMPVVLSDETWKDWLTADFDELVKFSEPISAEKLDMDRTDRLWTAR